MTETKPTYDPLAAVTGTFAQDFVCLNGGGSAGRKPLPPLPPLTIKTVPSVEVVSPEGNAFIGSPPTLKEITVYAANTSKVGIKDVSWTSKDKDTSKTNMLTKFDSLCSETGSETTTDENGISLRRERFNHRRQQRLNMPVAYRMFESQCEEIQGTVFGPDDDEFHPEEASKMLRQALSAGLQCDDKMVIDVLLRHNNFQRQKIAAAYEGMYDRVLADDIEEIAGGFFLDCTLALLQPTHVYATKLLNFAISSRAYNRSIAVEIALTATASQLKVIRDTYYTEYRISLERDLNVKVEGLFGEMLKSLLLRSKDPDSTAVDLDYVDSMVDAVARSENGVDEIGRNLDLFEKIFVNQSLSQLRCFFDRYDAQAMRVADEESPKARDFETSVRKSVNMHADIRHMLILFVKVARNVQLYFADKLHDAISGSRCDHATIVRIMVTRSELDLYDICEEYKRKYERSIVSDLRNTCSGDFFRLLRRLVDPNSTYISSEDSSPIN